MCSFSLPSAPNSQHFDWKKAGYSCPPLWGPRSAYTKILKKLVKQFPAIQKVLKENPKNPLKQLLTSLRRKTSKTQ